MKHTPGEWLYASTETGYSVVDTDGFFICRLTKEAASSRNIGAHARLISAAPDLLRALKWAEDFIDFAASEAWEIPLGQAARFVGLNQCIHAAINKATK